MALPRIAVRVTQCTKQPTLQTQSCSITLRRRLYATATANTPSARIEDINLDAAPVQRHHPTQPPSLKPPELRKSQLHRQYTSLLRTSPLILIFQHNNIRASEFSGIRRELASAMRKVDVANQHLGAQAEGIRLQVIQSGVFSAALRVVEFYKRDSASHTKAIDSVEQQHAQLAHDLSESAHYAAIPRNPKNKGIAAFKRTTPLHRMLSGPIAVLGFPRVSPQHLAAALSILVPTPGNSSAFPAPKRKTSPGYFEVPVQSGLQKLLLLGARVEDRVMDNEGTKWIGGIQGGFDGLRAQLVHTLESTGMGLSNTLEGAGTTLWVAMESRRLDMTSGLTESPP